MNKQQKLDYQRYTRKSKREKIEAKIQYLIELMNPTDEMVARIKKKLLKEANLPELMTDGWRFKVLRGYYQNGKYHSQGQEGLSLDELLKKMTFKNINEFSEWYSSLSANEISEWRSKWLCTGKCCNSILDNLIKLIKK